MIPVKCPSCQKSYKPVQDEFAGRKVTCQACKTLFVVAGPIAPPAAPKPAAQTLAPAPRPAAAKPAARPPAPAKPIAKPAAAPPPRPQPPAAAPKAAPPPIPPRPAAPKPAAAQAPVKPPAPAPKPAPKPPAVNPVDVETLAANALADTPPANPTAAPAGTPTTIDFRCPQCDTDVKMPATMAGKNAPCPECSRIVRVPMPTKKQPTDWRKVDTSGPSMAKRTEDQELDGVWSSSTAEKVTGGELVRAGVIEEKREPWTRWQKIRAAVVVAVVVGVLFGGFVGARSYWAHSQEEKALRKALDAVEGKGAPLDPLAAAEIHRAAGEFYARANQATEARAQFHKARGRLSDQALEGLPDRDALLLDVVMGQASLILGPDQMQKAKHRGLAEKQQDQVMEDIKETLAMVRSPEARVDALRRIARVLLAKQMGARAPELAAPAVFGDDQAEALAVIGLERFQAGQSSEANGLADMALECAKGPILPKDKEKPKAVIAPSLVTLCLLLKKPQEKLDRLNPGLFGNSAALLAWETGHAEALARQKNFDGARAPMQALQPLDKWRALAVIAATGLEQEPPVPAPAEELAKSLDAGALTKMADDERQIDKKTVKPDPSWLLLRLARLTAQAPNQEDLAKKLADAIPDTALRARARLDILRGRLQRSGGSAPDDWANEVDAPSIYPLAREALARHNARRAGGGTLKAVDAWTPETLRPFGYIGTALGIQDSGQ